MRMFLTLNVNEPAHADVLDPKPKRQRAAHADVLDPDPKRQRSEEHKKQTRGALNVNAHADVLDDLKSTLVSIQQGMQRVCACVQMLALAGFCVSGFCVS